MPTFNRSLLMKTSAEMLLTQTLADFELIVCDDCSIDDTPDVAASLQRSDRRVRYIRNDVNRGITHTINTGIRHAGAPLIQICHDHDIYLPTLLERLAGLMERHPSVAFAHPGRQGCDWTGQPIESARFVCGYNEVTPGRAWKEKMLRRLASPVTGLSMIRRSILDEAGLFDPEFGACADVEMWLRLCDYGDVGYVNELLIYLRGREPGHPFSGTNWNLIDQVTRAHRKHIRQAYSGLAKMVRVVGKELQIDWHLCFEYANSYRHLRWDDVARGREYLRSHGVLMSRLVGWIA